MTVCVTSAADLPAGHVGARGTPLCWPAGWDSPNSCLTAVSRLRCAKLAGAFGHVDDLLHAHALMGAETSAEVVGMTTDNMKGAKCLAGRDVPCLSHPLSIFLSSLEVQLRSGCFLPGEDTIS